MSSITGELPVTTTPDGPHQSVTPSSINRSSAIVVTIRSTIDSRKRDETSSQSHAGQKTKRQRVRNFFFSFCYLTVFQLLSSVVLIIVNWNKPGVCRTLLSQISMVLQEIWFHTNNNAVGSFSKGEVVRRSPKKSSDDVGSANKH